MKRGILIIFCIIGICVGIAFDLRKQNTQTTSTMIGFIGPLTGEVAGVGIPSRAAAEYAIEQWNIRNQKKFVLVAEDGGCDAKTATHAVQKLLNTSRVVAILGGLCSSETLAAAPLAEEANTILLSYASSDPSLTRSGEYIFRVYPSDAFQGEYAARYAFEKFGSRAAIIFTESAATQSIHDVFVKHFSKLGGSVVFSESIMQGAQDIRSVLVKLKQTDVDFLYTPTYTAEAITLLQQAYEHHISLPILANDGWEDATIYRTAGVAADGSRFVTGETPEVPLWFKKELQKRTGISDVPLIPAMQAYDGMNMLLEAFSRASDAGAARELLAHMTYPGISNPQIAFDENGDLARVAYVVKVVRNGAAVVEGGY